MMIIIAGKYVNSNLKRITDDHLALLICAVEEAIPCKYLQTVFIFFLLWLGVTID